MSAEVADLAQRRVEAQLTGLPYTDAGNARRLVEAHGSDLRYVPGIGWHAWDGRRWARDQDGAVVRRMLATADSIRKLAASLEGDARKELWKHAERSENGPRIKAAIDLARSDTAVIARAVDLDPDPYLLCVENGTLDLRTGELHGHDRGDLITKLAPVAYDPDARDERWERFLADTTGGDEELLRFLQRVAGYCLTGDTSEEKLFFVHGPAATGKSTFLEALKGTLGEYAATADFETFLQRRNTGGPRSGLAQLAGARLVVSVEVDEGRRLAEALVKTLTGGDTVVGSFLYQDSFEFLPAFKLCLAANQAPRVSDVDDALWRRILRVPLDRRVEHPDRSLKTQLREPSPAILAWAVEGCLAWQAGGLAVPVSVEQATDEYRADMDPLEDFLSERCALEPGARATSSDLYDAYKSWAEGQGDRVLSQRAFADRLRPRGCSNGNEDRVKVNGRRVRGWTGIRLLDGPNGEGRLL